MIECMSAVTAKSWFVLTVLPTKSMYTNQKTYMLNGLMSMNMKLDGSLQMCLTPPLW